LRRLTEAHEPNAVRLAAADAALELGDIGLAERALLGLSGAAIGSARHYIVRGRLAFVKTDIAEATTCFETAADREEKLRAVCHAELGSRLMSANRPREAVKAFEKSDPLPRKALPQYVRALMLTDQLVLADRLVKDQLQRADSIPDWALDAAAHIALVREDLEGAAA